MKIFRYIGYGVRDAFKSVKRNFPLTISSISCIAITLLVVSFALLASFNLKKISNKIEEDVTLITYLKLGVSSEEILCFESSLNENKKISPGWIKTTPADVKASIIEKNDDELLSSLFKTIDNEEEIFRYSYKIRLLDIQELDNVVEELKKNTSVDQVKYDDQTINKIVNILDGITKFSFVVVIVLLLVNIFLILNTIRLTIFSRKEEISIMRVVGASNLSIKFPFIIEGFVIGLLGSIIPVISTIVTYRLFYGKLEDGYIVSPIFEFIAPEPFVYFISMLLVLIGTVVGMVGSSTATRKYLKI